MKTLTLAQLKNTSAGNQLLVAAISGFTGGVASELTNRIMNWLLVTAPEADETQETTTPDQSDV